MVERRQAHRQRAAESVADHRRQSGQRQPPRRLARVRPGRIRRPHPDGVVHQRRRRRSARCRRWPASACRSCWPSELQLAGERSRPRSTRRRCRTPRQPDFARMARTNGYPSACVGTDGVLRVVFSKRIPQPGRAGRHARVRPNHVRHAQREQLVESQPIDNHSGPGHQFQPAIACTGTRATAVWYDQRSDAAFSYPLLPWVFFPFIVEPMTPPPTHTIDVRAVQTDAAGVFQPRLVDPGLEVPAGVRHGVAGVRAAAVQLPQLCPVRGRAGAVPRGLPRGRCRRIAFTPPLCANAACTQMTGWAFNTFANESPLVHGLWTDNRDVLQTGRTTVDVDRLDELRGAWRRGVHAQRR